MKPSKAELIFLAITIALWCPAFFSTILGPRGMVAPLSNCTPLNCFGNFWDRYEALFMALDLLAFIPFSFLVVRFVRRAMTLHAFLFTLIGMWWIILAIPDWLQGDLTPNYDVTWFGIASTGMFVILGCIYIRSLRAAT